VVPQARGKFKIPGVSFSYFNPKEEKYYSVETEPIVLNALSGVELPDDGTIGINKQAVVSNEGDIRYIHLKSSFVSTLRMKTFLVLICFIY